MNTFVYHDGALGDLLLSLPCLDRLKAASHAVHMTGRADVARFLRQAGIVDAASSSNEALFASLYSETDRRLREFLSGFDRACLFTARGDSAPADAIRAVIADTRIIRTIPPRGLQMHASQFRLSQFEPGAFVSGKHQLLTLPSANVDEAGSLLRNAGCRPGTTPIAAHPGSGGRLKCWPLERYFDLLERLQSENELFVVLFTGEAEESELREAVRRYAGGRNNVLHAACLDLMSAASLLSCCGLYIGNDSGFSHLAGLLGCATVVLFGPTSPFRWKPLGPNVHVVAPQVPGPIGNIGIDDVTAAIRSAME